MSRSVRRLRGLIIAVLAVLLVVMVLEWWSPPWWRRLSYPLDFRFQIAAAAERHEMDPYLIAALIRVESSFDPSVRSPKGAIGLMQVLPSTARYVAKVRGRPYVQENLYRPVHNIDVGTYYLRRLRDRYGRIEYALAAYNGGEANVDRWLSEGLGQGGPADFVADIPFRETRLFVSNVLRTRRIYRALYAGAFDEARAGARD